MYDITTRLEHRLPFLLAYLSVAIGAVSGVLAYIGWWVLVIDALYRGMR